MLLVEQDLQGDFTKDRFCHQFVLGPEFVDALRGWQRVVVDDSFRLTVHPEVAVNQVSEGTKSITFIGYILDPLSPDADNADIVRTLLDEFSNVENLIAATTSYGGRWVVIARDGKRRVMFNDALGLRQIFHTTPDFSNGLWAMTQPGILAWFMDLHVDEQAERFIDSYEFRTRPEYRWPGTATAFHNLRRLFPNHYLDLCAGTCHRYWPDQPLQKLRFDEGIEKTIWLLKGLMRAARQRFDLYIGMTAGFDSRIVLAACRDLKAGITGVTVRQGRMPDNHQDVTVAARLLGRMGIPHHVIKAQPYMSAEFSRTFKQNVFLAHDHYGPDAEALLYRFSRSKTAVTGGGAEVLREPFRKNIDVTKHEFTANDLAALQSMGDNAFAVNSFQQWLDELDDLYNVHLLDLFSWEQSHGNWLAATQLEFDLAWRDIFTPFNCRELLVTMLAIDERQRSSPDHRAFRVLIERMWPELLDEPINPEKKADSQRLGKISMRVKNVIKSKLFR